MKLERYDTFKGFADDVLDILLEDEACNNIMIANVLHGKEKPNPEWFYATVKDDSGSLLLTALCTPPFNLTLYETGNHRNDAAVSFFVKEAVEAGLQFPGVLAEQGLAHRFAVEYTSKRHIIISEGMKMNILKLTEVANTINASGKGRWMAGNDLYFVPYWEVEFSRECGVHVPDLKEHFETITA